MSMARTADYRERGHTTLRALLPAELCEALAERVMRDFKAGEVFPPDLAESRALPRNAFEIYGRGYPPLDTFHWGMTPLAAEVAGAELLPSFCFFRIYRRGDTLRVHSDRVACEHSLSLQLTRSGDGDWPLDFAETGTEAPEQVREDFGGAPFRSAVLQPGDGIFYQGITRAHGRLMPNPNPWSAHLFLHWVDRNGPYAAWAFDRGGQRADQAIRE
jgi:hypothetical protein